MSRSSYYVPALDHAVRAFLYFYVFSFPLSIAGGNLCIDIAAILAGVRILLQRHDLRFDRKFFFLLALYGAMLVGFAFVADNLATGFRQAFTAIYYTLPPFLLAQLFIAPQKRFYYLGLMMIAVLVSSSYAYVQAVGGAVRSAGFIAPLELAGNVSLLLPISVLLVCEQSSPKNNRRIHALSIITFLLFSAALILTGTRGAWLAVGVTIAIYLLYFILTYRNSYLVTIFFLSLILLTVFGLSFVPAAQKRMASITNPNEYSIVTRFAMWQSASRMWSDHPVLGVGLSNYQRFYKNQYYDPVPWEQFGKNHDGLTHKHPHNIYLYLLAETGVAGFSVFLLLIGYMFRHFYAMIKTGAPTSQFFAKMALLVLIAYLSFGMTENLIFGMYPTMQSLWFLLGMLWNPYNSWRAGGKR